MNMTTPIKNRSQKIAGLVLTTAFFGFGVAQAQNSHQDLEQLSNRKYSDRQRATLEMWQQRDSSRDEVQKAARDPDPEVAGRAQWILRQWRRGALPNIPPEISRLSHSADGAVSIERLLEGGQFAAAVVAVEESAGTVDRETIQQRITSALVRRYPIYVHLALQSESLHELLKLIDLVADTSELATCRIQLMQHLGLAITDDALLPGNAETWSKQQQDRTTVMLLALLGRHDEATELAKQINDQDLLLDCMRLTSQWKQVTKFCLDQAETFESGSLEHAHWWCQTLIAADRDAQQALVDRAIGELSDVAFEEGEYSGFDLRWKCLAIHGAVDEALSLLEQVNPSSAATAAVDTARVEQAFQFLGCPIDRVDQDLMLWINQALEEQKTSSIIELSPQMQRLLALMHCLMSIGRDDAAWIIASSLCQSDHQIGSHRVREYVLLSLSSTKRSQWIVPLAIEEDESSLSPTSHDTVARVLPDCDASTLERVLNSLELMFPRQSMRLRLDWATDLFQGKIPDGFNPETHFEKLLDLMSRPRETRSARSRLSSLAPIQANMNIVQLFLRHSRTDEASQCLQRLIATGDTDAVFLLAEQSLDGGSAETAYSLFNSVFETVQSQGRTSSRIGGTADVTLAGKSLIGMWTIARRGGDKEDAARLLREIRLALTSPSSRFRYSMARYLAEREENAMALEAYQPLLPMTFFAGDDSVKLYDAARGYALVARKTDPIEAARWFDLAVTRSISSDDFRPSAFLTLPIYVRRWSIEAAMESESPDDARRHIDRLLQLDRLDIDLAERLLPELRRAGMGDLADETLDRIMNQGLQYTQSYALDAMTCNNLAWVAAMNSQRLPDALKLAQMAVFVEPDSAIYRDTLAEVLFALGRYQEALNIEKGCLLDDPGQWHLHQQIEKYQKALDGSKSQEH